jgi:hypothetical protein
MHSDDADEFVYVPITKARNLYTEHVLILENVRRLSAVGTSPLGFDELYEGVYKSLSRRTKSRYRNDAFRLLTEIRTALQDADREEQKRLLPWNAVEFLLQQTHLESVKELNLLVLGRGLSDTYRDEARQQQRQQLQNNPPLLPIFDVQEGSSSTLSGLARDLADDYDIHRQMQGLAIVDDDEEMPPTTSGDDASSSHNNVDFSSSADFCRSYLASAHVSEEIRKQHEAAQRNVLLNKRRLGHVQLTKEQISILCRSETDDDDESEYRIENNRSLIAHISVREGLTQAAVTRILKDYHKHKVQFDYRELPTTAKTLLKITKEDIASMRIRDIYAPVNVGRGLEKTASYLHVGILKSLLLQSCGVVQKWQYINTMRLVYTLFPEMVPKELLAVIRPQPGEEYDKKILKDWSNLPEPDQTQKRKLVLEIHGHLDGVKWFENSLQPKGVPILGRLVGIRDEVTGEYVKITTLDPFIIGALHLYSKTSTKEFVKDFVEELRTLANEQLSEVSFKVSNSQFRLTVFILLSWEVSHLYYHLLYKNVFFIKLKKIILIIKIIIIIIMSSIFIVSDINNT